MDVIKSNELFTLVDVTESYVLEGQADVRTDGSFNLILDFRTPEGEFLGSGSYNKYSENAHVHYSISCSEPNFDVVSGYVNKYISESINYFKNNN